MIPDTGSVVLRLQLRHGRVAHAEIDCRRPTVSRMLIGRTPKEAMALVPLLFAVCGKAQGLAARLALRSAQGETIAPHRAPEAAQEAAREHLWHLLPGESNRASLAQGTRCLQTGEGVPAFVAEMMGMSPAEWLALDDGGLNRWLITTDAPIAAAIRIAHPRMDEVPVSSVPLLPVLSAEESIALWPRLDADFAARPTWRESPAETGALARSGNVFPSFATISLLQRKLARIAELAAYAANANDYPQPGTASAVPVAPRRGRALVETARGLLMHEIALDESGERIADYQIVAPTEWNFHPLGTLGPWLQGLPAQDAAALQDAIRRRVEALDPCVPWRTELLPA